MKQFLLLIALAGTMQFAKAQSPSPGVPYATVAGMQNGDRVARSAIAKQVGIGVFVMNAAPGSNTRYSVTGFRVALLRGDKLVFSAANKGNSFSETVKEALGNIQEGDLLVFSDIHASAINMSAAVATSEERILPSVAYSIKE